MIKTNILKIKGDWKEVLNDCRFTVNKKDLDKEPSEKFKKHILIAEHSPIRDITIKWEWRKLPHWVVGHWVRHKWEKYVATQRSDRTGVDRHNLSQCEPQDMRGEANIQHHIDTERKRLCFQASPETRECAESFKLEIHENYDKYIADVLVPNCIYRFGCSEFEHDDPNRCKFFESFLKKAEENNVDLSNIQERYDFYNKMFYSKFSKE